MTDRTVLAIEKGSAWRALRADPGFAPALALAFVSTSMAVSSPPAWIARVPDGIAVVASGPRPDEQALRLRQQAMAAAEEAKRERDRQIESMEFAAAERQRLVDDLQAQLQATRESLAADLALARAEAESARRMAASAPVRDPADASKISELERALSQAHSAVRSEIATTNAIQGQLTETLLANQRLNNDMARLKSQLDVMGAARQPADVARIAELEAQLASSKQSLDRSGIAIAATESKLAAAGQTIRALESEQTAARQALKLAQERLVEQQNVTTDRLAKLEASLAQVESLHGRQRAELEAATDRVATLKAEADAGRAQVGRLLTLLGAASAQSQRQEEIIDKQNAAIGAAGAVADFNRYRIEFLDRLKAVVGDREGFAVAGDRATIQSEVLFASGSAELSLAGRAQLQRIAASLRSLAPTIPPDLDWVLQVDGHTDRVPIRTTEFKSNWELSASRAIAVVRVMIDSGIAPRRLSANGFGEHRPVAAGDSPDNLARNRRIELSLISR